MPCSSSSSFTSLALADRVGVGADGAGGDDGGLDGVGVLLLGEAPVRAIAELREEGLDALGLRARSRDMSDLGQA